MQCLTSKSLLGDQHPVHRGEWEVEKDSGWEWNGEQGNWANVLRTYFFKRCFPEDLATNMKKRLLSRGRYGDIWGLAFFFFFLAWLLSSKESSCQSRRRGFSPWVQKIPWRRNWQLTPVFLPGKSHGQRSLVGYSLWDHKELDIPTKQQWII